MGSLAAHDGGTPLSPEALVSLWRGRRASSKAQATSTFRVVLVIGQLQIGGTERQLFLLAQGLHQRGVDVCVVPLFRLGEYAQKLRDSAVPIWQPGFPTRAEAKLKPWKVITALARLTLWLHRLQPDVVHAFLYHAMVVAIPCARLARVPIVVGGRRSLSSPVVGRPGRCVGERVVSRMCDRIVANSEAVADDVRTRHRLPRSHAYVINNGLPPEAFEPTQRAYLCTDRPVVLTVANLHPYKGHTYLIDAVAALATDGHDVTLVFAGAGPQEATLRLKAVRADLDVRFLGSRSDVRELLAACDAFVLPSLTEGASNAVLEAMAAGCVTIATDVGGNRELIADAGLLVPARDSQALRAAIASVLTDPYRAQQFRTRARERARDKFSVDTLIETHIGLYRSLRDELCAASPAT